MQAPPDPEHIADKLFLLLDALYNWIRDQHPAVIGRIPTSLNAQILYVLGEITIDDATIFDDSIIGILASELAAQHRDCNQVPCAICDAINTYHTILTIR